MLAEIGARQWSEADLARTVSEYGRHFSAPPFLKWNVTPILTSGRRGWWSMRTPLKSEDESVQSDLELFLTALPSSSGRVTVEFDDTMCRKSAEAKSAALLSAPDVTSCASESRIYSAWRRRFSGAKFQTSPRPRSAQTGLSLSHKGQNPGFSDFRCR